MIIPTIISVKYSSTTSSPAGGGMNGKDEFYTNDAPGLGRGCSITKSWRNRATSILIVTAGGKVP